MTKFIWNCIKPFRGWLLLLMIGEMYWAFDLSLRPYLLKVLVDSIIDLDPVEAYTGVSFPACCYLVALLFRVATLRFYMIAWRNINPPLQRHIGALLMQRMMQHAHQLYQNNFAGSLGNKIKDVMNGVPDLVKLLAGNTFAHCLSFMMAAIVFWSVAPQFAGMLFLWMLTFTLGAYYLSKKVQHLSHAAAVQSSSVVGMIVDILGNIMSVRLFTGHQQEMQQLHKRLDHCVHAEQKRDSKIVALVTFNSLSFFLYQVLSLFLLMQGYQQKTITAGDFVLILTINKAILESLRELFQDLSKYAKLTGSIKQGLSIVLAPLAIKDQVNAQTLHVTQGHIVFDAVQFHYKETTSFFQNQSVQISAGQKVGLVGYSGSGKSTFMHLILRLFDVIAGQILIDGQPIQTVTQASLRANIALIPQDPSLFHRTLMDNIRYGKPGATVEEVIEAAKKAAAHDFICQLPQGYQSMVGERGVKLSGGQRQRIAIARAILKNAPILLIDEATSQLDSVTERAIQTSLWTLMQGKTTLVIAHRLATLLHMDYLLVFDQGKIVQEGPHQALIATNGLYKTMWDAQVGAFLPTTQLTQRSP